MFSMELVFLLVVHQVAVARPRRLVMEGHHHPWSVEFEEQDAVTHTCSSQLICRQISCFGGYGTNLRSPASCQTNPAL